MTTPTITHHQALVLSLLGHEHSGRDLRAELTKRGFKQSSPAFYRLMSRVEEMGLVNGTYRNREVSGQIVRERHYKVTGKGNRALNESVRFYATMEAKHGQIAIDG